MTMALDLRDKRVLVVGAGGGIGGATAKAFADAGAHVFAAGRPGAKLNAVAAEIGDESVALDILDNDAIEAFFATAEPFDHVVIAAAATKSGPFARLPLDDAQSSMQSKFWGAYRIARAAKVVDGGSITFVSGLLSHRPSGGAVLQGAINAALEALGRGLALERAPVRVNTVSPGLIDTPLWGGTHDTDREAMFARTAERLPARRIGQPEDIAQAILFLATNPFATGTTVTVDGGGTIA
jgi:NAD(P)-dependent dehydrogenase (short-subunit alcohol dehydrogenase family)